MKIRPMFDRVLVKRDTAPEMSAGGLFLPAQAQNREKPTQGTVVAAGPGRCDDKGNHVPMGLAEGDKILFGQYAGSEVQLEGETYLILREADIIATVADE